MNDIYQNLLSKVSQIDSQPDGNYPVAIGMHPDTYKRLKEHCDKHIQNESILEMKIVLADNCPVGLYTYLLSPNSIEIFLRAADTYTTQIAEIIDFRQWLYQAQHHPRVRSLHNPILYERMEKIAEQISQLPPHLIQKNS